MSCAFCTSPAKLRQSRTLPRLLGAKRNFRLRCSLAVPFCTANSASRREIASGTQVQNARQPISQSSAGFTLIELIITMVLIGILALTLPAFIANWLAASSLGQAQNNLLANAENALDTINTDIQLSGAADDNNRWADPNGPGGNEYGWASNSSTLILAKAAVDSNNDVIFADPAKYISQKDNEIYYVNGTTLYRRTLKSDSSNDAAVTTCPPPGVSGCPADKTIATGVSSFTVQYYDANEDQVDPADARSIQLSITLTSKSGSKPLTASYSTRMVFRNE